VLIKFINKYFFFSNAMIEGVFGLTMYRIFWLVCSRFIAVWIEWPQWAMKPVGIFIFYHLNRITLIGTFNGKSFSMIEELMKVLIGGWLMALMVRRGPSELIFGIAIVPIGRFVRIPTNSTSRWLKILARWLYPELLVHSNRVFTLVSNWSVWNVTLYSTWKK